MIFRIKRAFKNALNTMSMSLQSSQPPQQQVSDSEKKPGGSQTINRDDFPQTEGTTVESRNNQSDSIKPQSTAGMVDESPSKSQNALKSHPDAAFDSPKSLQNSGGDLQMGPPRKITVVTGREAAAARDRTKVSDSKTLDQASIPAESEDSPSVSSSPSRIRQREPSERTKTEREMQRKDLDYDSQEPRKKPAIVLLLHPISQMNDAITSGNHHQSESLGDIRNQIISG